VPELHILGSADSTNDVARRLADHGAAAGTTIIAEEQTAGRGRLGRAWEAPFGKALLVSFILRPGAGGAIRLPTAVPIQVGLAVARAIELVTGIDIGLKWPNDIIVPGAGKVAGILCEGALGDAMAEYVIAGVGINVNQRVEELPPEVRGSATSLALVTGREVPRAALAAAVIDRIRPFAAAAGEPLDPTALLAFSRRDVLRGREILLDGDAAGTARGIMPDGALALDSGGHRRIVRGGTVRLARPDRPAAPGGYPVGSPMSAGQGG
jgi:BirA family biotin operon repressor/biotin-[acetyl-CoA-carboxylase] ligase